MPSCPIWRRAAGSAPLVYDGPAPDVVAKVNSKVYSHQVAVELGFKDYGWVASSAAELVERGRRYLVADGMSESAIGNRGYDGAVAGSATGNRGYDDAEPERDRKSRYDGAVARSAIGNRGYSVGLTCIRGGLLVKDPFGVSGKGNCWSNPRGCWSGSAAHLAAQERAGKRVSLLLEPFLAKELDFSCQMRIDADGTVHCLVAAADAQSTTILPGFLPPGRRTGGLLWSERAICARWRL